MNQYCAYTHDHRSLRLALRLIRVNGLAFECHINRTRFWVPKGTPLDTLCSLQFKCVNAETDHSLGT